MYFTNFEIYGTHPDKLVEFYRQVFDWQIEKMEGIDYWRITTPPSESNSLNGGLTYRTIPNLNGFLLYVNVNSMDETLEKIIEMGGSIVRPKTAVPRAGWVTIVSDPEQNIFGIWQADLNAFPVPHPD
jgi:predicted enzyme related to lactoylglutathione lyase